ncbi:uncharacterized protein LOC129959929 [Argiope bruennichi]|uniref:Uncharacterized protein n=1 Tax=Argiope bruennichi TaxID=94029 RepID=A0A8T0FJ44_ARGBR|nr:uncharacterized protein LOC129959929 [Argiope bruennichi]KAF8791274.1 hypothetical protein HNY73_006166 [Argiope bruennichi]
MLFFVSCLILLAGESLCLPSANQYVDTVLHTTLQNVILNEKYEPTHLPDFTFEYTDKTFMGKVHGKADYKEGSLSGLSQVSRVGDCQGPLNVSGSTVINCTLGFNYLKTSYKGKVKYGVLPKVSIEAKAEVSATWVVVGIAKGFNQREATVKSFALRQIGQVTPHYTGLGPLNKYVKVLQENYKSRVASEVTNVINNRFKYALNLAVAQVPMPLR